MEGEIVTGEGVGHGEEVVSQISLLAQNLSNLMSLQAWTPRQIVERLSGVGGVGETRKEEEEVELVEILRTMLHHRHHPLHPLFRLSLKKRKGQS